MVVLRSTTPCVSWSSSSRSNFFTLNSIGPFLFLLSGRADAVASVMRWLPLKPLRLLYCFSLTNKYIRKPSPSPQLWILRKTL